MVGPADFFLARADWRICGRRHGKCCSPSRRRHCLLRNIPQGWYKTLIFIVIAPIIGLVLGFLFMLSIYWIFRRSAPQPVDRLFRRLQLLSAAAYSLGHGANDAQKTMGIVAGALYTGGFMKQIRYVGEVGANSTGPSSWPPTQPSLLELISEAGASLRPWARKSPN